MPSQSQTGKRTGALTSTASNQDTSLPATDRLTMTIPTGRIQAKVLDALKEIGIKFTTDGRNYRPIC